MGHTVISNNKPAFDHTGWCHTTHMTDHAILQRWVKKLAPASLKYVYDDLVAARKAMPDNVKAGHYTDTAIYIAQRMLKK